MRWLYFVPHGWSPAESREQWADVILLPDDSSYKGSALCVTVDAILDSSNYSDPEWADWHRQKVSQMGDADFYMDMSSMDLAVRAADFDKSECLAWVSLWLRESGLPFSELAEGSAHQFAARHPIAAVVDRVKR